MVYGLNPIDVSQKFGRFCEKFGRLCEKFGCLCEKFGRFVNSLVVVGEQFGRFGETLRTRFM
jgi:hypothetical protein